MFKSCRPTGQSASKQHTESGSQVEMRDNPQRARHRINIPHPIRLGECVNLWLRLRLFPCRAIINTLKT